MVKILRRRVPAISEYGEETEVCRFDSLSVLLQNKSRSIFCLGVCCLVALIFSSLMAQQGFCAAAAGYSEYFIPGDEDIMSIVLDDIGYTDESGPTHSVISFTAWSDNTVVYYDHWEDGYDFDPADPSTADETFYLVNRGDYRSLESSYIPVRPRGTSIYYDGKDRIYAAGGILTVSRASWVEDIGTVESVAWEVYPVRPQLTTYIMPFGEDLADPAGADLQDFERVYALIQATENNTVIQVDLDHDGIYDNLDWNRDGVNDGVDSYTLNMGEVFLLDDVSAQTTLSSGTIIHGSETLQVQYVIGDQGSNYEIRGLSAFPRGFWDDEYYAPVDGPAASDDPVDIYLYNPHDSSLTINYSTAYGSGSFSIPPTSTVSFQAATGVYAPVDSGLYFRGSDVFWGISTIDTSAHDSYDFGEGRAHDWGYSLVPAFLLENEHYMGWAPGAFPTSTGSDADDSGIYITPAGDNIRLFVDYDNDGVADQTYNLNHLQTQYVFDPNDGDMSGAHVFATGPYTIAYGQNPDTAPPAYPAIDVGYTTIPGNNFIELVLTVDKSVSPSVVPTAAGSQATFTIKVNSYDFSVDNIDITDTLPSGWQYVDDSTTITLADQTVLTGNAADPVISGSDLIWSSSLIGSMAQNQEIEIVFTAETTVAFATGDLSRNDVEAVGTRTVQGVVQTFSTSDFAFISYGDLQMDKATSGVDPLYPGDSYTYTITVTNPAPSAGVSHVTVYDPLADGISYVDGTAQVSAPVSGSLYVADFFTTSSFDNNDGTNEWEAGWIEDDTAGAGPGSGNVVVTGGLLVLDDYPDTGTQPSAARDVNLARYTSAVFSFDWQTGVIETDDVAVAEISDDGGLSYTILETFTNLSGNNSGSRTYDITPYISADTRIRFRIAAVYGGSDDYFAVDNVVIKATRQGAIRATEYYLASGQFTGTTYNLTLNQDLAPDYFVIVRGSDGNGSATRGPDENYAALAADPFGTGDLANSGAPDVITLTRGNAVDSWVGVVTVVESLSDHSGGGFNLLDVQRVVHPAGATSGTDTTTVAWSDLSRVMLMGGAYGAGCDTTEPNSANTKTCHARIWPSGTNTINWTRDAGGAVLAAAASTVMVLQWGADWTVQRVRVQGNNGGNGIDAATEYNTALLGVPVERDHTWVWGCGHTNDQGIGDGPEGVAITLGDGVVQNATESQVAVGIEYAGNAVDFEVYTLTHPDIFVDYRFKADGDTAALTVDVPVDAAPGNRMALVTNGCNGTGNAYPRPIFSARYIDPSTIRLERRYSGQAFPAWVQGIVFGVPSGVNETFPAQPPPNLITSGDSYSLAPGESLVVTFDVVVDNPLPAGIDYIVNTGFVTTAEYPLPISDTVTNIVVNPSALSAKAGDRVWLDSDGDGVFDVGEAGLDNVEVTLKDQYGTPVATALTDINGFYLFEGITPGTGYYVEITGGLPAGLVQTAPSGHTDNRTDPFDLSAGQDYRDADLGYAPAPGTGIIGDTVWSDADSDGFMDSGEVGISGVTVELWEDDGDGIFEGAGQDTLIGTQVSDPGGGYFFTGVPASGTEDYFVFVDAGQAALSGYDPTTAVERSVIGLASGDTRTDNDFGFNNPSTYSITDRVWFDVDSDENDDNANPNEESGIQGVSVDLLDASRNIMATTITDAGGYFTFSGLQGAGADYTVSITDTAGKLTDYYGTTSFALSGERGIANLTGDIDYSAEPSEPSFGYNLSRAIGDTVFNDIGGVDGVQDTGEPGISGVTVDLYLDDGDGVFEPGTAPGQDGNPVASLVTDADGKYLFTGMNDGTYFVHIDNTQSALTGYDQLTTPDDEPAAGHQREVTLTSGSVILDIDYGYRSSVQRSVSGALWDDTDSDGVMDTGESGIENVTVELLSGTTVLMTTVTDASGGYAFSGLPPGAYTVRISDQNGILTDFTTTYEVSEGANNPPYDGEEPVDVTSGDSSGINFGYFNPRPTFVLVSHVWGQNIGGRGFFGWETDAEVGTIGFYIDRFDSESKAWLRVNQRMVPSVMAPQGGKYLLADAKAYPGESVTYRIIEKTARGKSYSYGPYNVVVPDKEAGLDSLAAKIGDSFYARIAHDRNRVSVSKVSLSGDNIYKGFTFNFNGPRLDSRETGQSLRLKALVDQTGIYKLTAQAVADLSGISVEDIKKQMAAYRLQIVCKGDRIRYLAGDDGEYILFFARKEDSIYTDTNIYWINLVESLKKGDLNADGIVDDLDATICTEILSGSAAAGLRNDYASSGADVDGDNVVGMAELSYISGVISDVAANRMPLLDGLSHTLISEPAVYQARLHHEQDLFDATYLAFDPESDYWFEAFVFAGDPDFGKADFVFELSGVENSGQPVSLTINLYGAVDLPGTEDHSFEVSVNGVPVGQGTFDGIKAASFTCQFDSSVLAEGENTLEIKGISSDGDAFAVDSFDLTYQRRLLAISDMIGFDITPGADLLAAGFADEEIAVFDVTDPENPYLLDHVKVIPYGDGFGAVFSSEGTGGKFFVASSGGLLEPDLVIPAENPEFEKENPGADYLVITHESLRDAAGLLEAYRRQTGFSPLVVTVDEIYDRYSYGIRDPMAVARFIEDAAASWDPRPRYVVLVGDGTYDYKNHFQTADNLVPVLMTLTPEGLFASDNRFVDFNGDGIPEIPVGRIPADTPADVAAYLAKLQQAEQDVAGGLRHLLIVADNPDNGGDFVSDSDSIAEKIMPPDTYEKIYISEKGASGARDALIQGINQGPWLVNYIGHGGMDRLADESILRIDDVSVLSNTRYPVFLALTCVAGRFSVPGFDSLSEVMCLDPAGGFSAAWSPSGLSYNDDAVRLNKAFFDAVYTDKAKDLGSAVVNAYIRYKSQGGRWPYLPAVYNLLGDPAMRLE